MYTRGDRCGDSRLVYTLKATGRRDDRSDSRGDDRPVYTPYIDVAEQEAELLYTYVVRVRVLSE